MANEIMTASNADLVRKAWKARKRRITVKANKREYVLDLATAANDKRLIIWRHVGGSAVGQIEKVKFSTSKVAHVRERAAR